MLEKFEPAGPISTGDAMPVEVKQVRGQCLVILTKVDCVKVCGLLRKPTIAGELECVDLETEDMSDDRLASLERCAASCMAAAGRVYHTDLATVEAAIVRLYPNQYQQPQTI